MTSREALRESRGERDDGICQPIFIVERTQMSMSPPPIPSPKQKQMIGNRNKHGRRSPNICDGLAIPPPLPSPPPMIIIPLTKIYCELTYYYYIIIIRFVYKTPQLAFCVYSLLHHSNIQ